jgi:hypothetical protein
VSRALGALGLSIGLIAACLACAAPARAGVEEAPASERLVLVMAADPSINRPDLRGARSGAYRQSRRYPGVPSDRVRAMRELAADYAMTYVDAWPMRSLGMHCAVFEAGPGAELDALVAQLSADPRVESAQAMHRFDVLGEAGGSPDDPYRGLQQSFDALGIAAAQRWATGRGVRVAVVDTGIALRHPDLAGQVAERRDFIGGAASGDRHGTAVAGLIAAQAGNRLGIVGIAPGARLLALRACEQREADGRGSCTTFDLARAIDFAIDAEARVLNLSLGGPQDRLLERLIAQAIERRIIVVAAAGEGGAAFPSAMDGVIAVGSDAAKPQAPTLLAPGRDVLSLAPPDGYDYFSGSSVAAAQVSGIVALLLERAPTLDAEGARRALASTAGDAVRPVVQACSALAEVGPGVNC